MSTASESLYVHEALLVGDGARAGGDVNLNVLLMYADEQQVYRLVDHLIQKTREREVSGAYTVVEGAIGEQTLAKLQNRFDTVRGV